MDIGRFDASIHLSKSRRFHWTLEWQTPSTGKEFDHGPRYYRLHPFKDTRIKDSNPFNVNPHHDGRFKARAHLIANKFTDLVPFYSSETRKNRPAKSYQKPEPVLIHPVSMKTTPFFHVYFLQSVEKLMGSNFMSIPLNFGTCFDGAEPGG